MFHFTIDRVRTGISHGIRQTDESDELDNPHFLPPTRRPLAPNDLRTGVAVPSDLRTQCQYTPPHVAMILRCLKSSSCTVLELDTPVWKLDRAMALEVPHNHDHDLKGIPGMCVRMYVWAASFERITKSSREYIVELAFAISFPPGFAEHHGTDRTSLPCLEFCQRERVRLQIEPDRAAIKRKLR
uniref:Uncharacterized protein n=1 Tax=Anopheles culicifacies TaxID=139723 RepID=A0A182MP77_9DIPT